jgi:ATP-dependent DNA helicase RecQ
MLPDGTVQSLGKDPRQTVKIAVEQQELRREAKRERLHQMRDYAEASGCRRRMLLQYLGDTVDGPCNHCDNCDALSGHPAADPEAGTRREVA